MLWTSEGFRSISVLQLKSIHTRSTTTGSSTQLHSTPPESTQPPANDYEDLRQKLKGTSVYLVGMMGSGKSTVGKILAEKLGYRFLDTDEVAEYMIEMPIAEFFAQGKVEQFRDVEYQVLMELAQYTRLVISTGACKRHLKSILILLFLKN
jgi:shikimate kinase